MSSASCSSKAGSAILLIGLLLLAAVNLTVRWAVVPNATALSAASTAQDGAGFPASPFDELEHYHKGA